MKEAVIYLFIHLFFIQPIVHGGAPVTHLKMAISDRYANISSTCAMLLKYYIAKCYGIMTHTRPSKFISYAEHYHCHGILYYY